jgi:hypothetical protein
MERIIYYHGSKKEIKELERKVPLNADPKKPLECLNAIYLTNEWPFAFFMGVRLQKSRSSVAYLKNITKKRKPIYFEDLNEFDPEKKVFIYHIDISKIPDDKIIRVDEIQIALMIDTIKLEKAEEVEAGEIFKYFYIDKNMEIYE